MTMPATIIVDVVFLPIYVVLALLSLCNVIKHGHGKASGFVYLLIFPLVRLVGNVLLVYSYHDDYRNATTLQWGFIMQGLGYSFLISAALAFVARASSSEEDQHEEDIVERAKRPTLQKLLHLVNLAALILLILGYTDSDAVFAGLTGGGNSATAKLDAKVGIGCVIYIVLTLVVGVLVVARKLGRSPVREHHVILTCLLVALPFMLVRAGYATYSAFTPDPLHRNLAVKTVLQYVMEAIANGVLCAMGFLIGRQSVKAVV